VKTYEAIIKGQNIPAPGVPESFKVLIKELQSLCLDIKALDADKNEIVIPELDPEDGLTPESVTRNADREDTREVVEEAMPQVDVEEDIEDTAETDLTADDLTGGDDFADFDIDLGGLDDLDDTIE